MVRDGRAAAFFRSYHAGTTLIRATSPGLDDAVLEVVTAGGPPLEGPSPVPLDRPAPPGAPDEPSRLAPGVLTHFGRDNPTKASSSHLGRPSRHVNDGSAATYWAPLDSDGEPWVVVDLERLVKVHQVQLTFPTAGPYRFVVEASKDRTTWAVIADRGGQAGTSTSRMRHLDVTEVVALQVRVRLLPADGLPSGVTELSVLGHL